MRLIKTIFVIAVILATLSGCNAEKINKDKSGLVTPTIADYTHLVSEQETPSTSQKTASDILTATETEILSPTQQSAPDSASASEPVTPSPAQQATPNSTSASEPVTPSPVHQATPDSTSATEPVTPSPAHQSAPDSTSASQYEISSSLPDTSPLGVYKSILLNDAEFFSTDANKYLKISQLDQTVSDDPGVSATAVKFTTVDLDYDGIPEVILWLAVNNDDYFGFEILRYKDGMVYGYTMWYRAFMELKTDGTFSFSSGAADYGFGEVTFEGNTYTTEKVAYSEPVYDLDGDISALYYVNGDNTTEGKFNLAISQQDEKADVIWYDFTSDRIDLILRNCR